MKFLHIADLHLGAKMRYLGPQAEERRGELVETLRRVVQMCGKDRIPYMVIAGDLFDSPMPEERLVNQVADMFAKIPGTRVIITPGNHDYISPGSCYLRENLWSENVYIFQGEWECLEFEDDKVCIYGAAFSSVYQKKTLLGERIPMTENGWIHVGVLHGDVVAENGISSYNPVNPRQIAMSKLNYLALGHIHKSGDLCLAGGTYFAYSGCLEGTGFDETGAFGAYLCDVTPERSQVAKYIFCNRRYEEFAVSVNGILSHTELMEKLQNCLAAYGERYNQYLYRIHFTGETEELLIDLQRIRNQLELYYVELFDETSPSVDYEKVAKEISLRGKFVQRMLARIEGQKAVGNYEEASLSEEAMKEGYRAFRDYENH